MTDELASKSIKPEPDKKKGCLGLVILAVIIALLVAMCSGGGDEDKPDPAKVNRGETTTTTEATTSTSTLVADDCDDHRTRLTVAKQTRIADGLSDPKDAEQRSVVDEVARDARAAGCDISDLVGPDVGA